MSFWRRLFGLEAKVANADALTYSALQLGAGSRTGLPVNEATALRVAAVLGCARVLAEDVSKLPIRVIRESENGGKELLRDHPVHRVLARRPNDWQTSVEWRQTMMLHALLTHGGHSWINRAPDGTVLELIPLMPHNVVPRQQADFSVVYDVSDGRGKITTLERSQVHVLRGLSWNGFTALPLIRQGAEAIGLAMASEETQARLHANGAKPGGILSTSNILTKEQTERIKGQFAENFAGVQNAFKTLLLDSGLSFTPWTMTGVDGQHLETRKFQIEEVCRLFRVFPQMIGASSAVPTYASAEAFFSAHVECSLHPWIASWEDAIRRDLFTEEESRLGVQAEFDMDSLLRANAEQRASFYESGIARGGWLSRNEARQREGLNPLPGLNEILPPAGSVTAGTASKGDTGPQGPPGRDGKDGSPGTPGKDGQDGKVGPMGPPGRDGMEGKSGRDGKDGSPGSPGRDGRDGKDGPSVEVVAAQLSGILFERLKSDPQFLDRLVKAVAAESKRE